MNTQALTVEKICETLRTLPRGQLDEVLRYVQDMELKRETVDSQEPIAPLYGIYTLAVKTGISDLAHKHDHYLYGTKKKDA